MTYADSVPYFQYDRLDRIPIASYTNFACVFDESLLKLFHKWIDTGN